jgi:glutamate synthase domain-containing protein 2
MKRIINWLYRLRTAHCFLTPREAHALADAAVAVGVEHERDNMAEERKAMVTLRHKYYLAIDNLVTLKLQTRKPCYEIKIMIPIGALETEAGSAAAISYVAHEVADKLVARHRKEMGNY